MDRGVEMYVCIAMVVRWGVEGDVCAGGVEGDVCAGVLRWMCALGC